MPRQRRIFLLTIFLVLSANVSSWGSTPSALPHESESGQSSKPIAAPNSVIELLQRLIQEHQRLRDLRSERATAEDTSDKLQSEADDLNHRLQATPHPSQEGEVTLKREQLERRQAAVQSRLNTTNQKLVKIDEEIDDLTSSRNAIAVALARRIGIFLIFAFIIWVLARLLKRIPARLVKQEQDRFYINKLITYSARLIVILIFLYTLFGELGSFSSFLGLTGAGVAIALQDVIVSFVAWFFIIGRRGLAIGDRIEVSGVRGDVVDIGVLRIVVQEVGNWLSNDVPTGRRVFIPNSFVFKNYFFNYTKPQPFINDEIKLLFTFESDWERALDVVKAAAREVLTQFFAGESAPKEMVPQNDSFSQWGLALSGEVPRAFMRVAESGVEIRVVYFTHVRDRNTMRDAMNHAILKAVRAHPEIMLAYPTSRAIPTPPGTKP